MIRISKITLYLIILSAIFLGCIGKETVPNSNMTLYNTTPYNNSMADNNSTNNQIGITFKNICESCHMSGKSSVPQATTIKPHINGDIYCTICHNFSHDKHPIDNSVTCEKCHGEKNPTKPTIINGSMPCDNCHDYPNPLQPSHGNIITIHRSREVSCITCHAEKCTRCHTDIGTDERWEKRLSHLRIMLNTQRYDNNI